MWWISRARSDSEIVRRVLQGRRDEFGLLVERYLSAVRAVAYAHTGNYADAQDIAQDTFVKALEHLNTLRDVACLGAWLATLARREASRLTRQRARREDLSQRNAPAAPEAVHPEVERQELRDMLHSQILSLPEEHREVLLLHYFAGKRVREIAALLEVSTDAVKKRLQRAREALSKSMTERLPDLLETKETQKESVARVTGLIALASPPWQAPGAAATGAVATAGGTLLALKSMLIAVAIAGIAGPLLWQQFASETPAPPGNGVMADASPTPAEIADASQPSTPESNADAQRSTAADGVVSGSVIEVGMRTPVPDVPLILVNDETKASPQATSDNQGNFQFKSVPDGTYSVLAHPGRMINAGPLPQCEVVAGVATGEVVVPVTLGGTVTGRVFERETDKGISGVHLWAAPVADDGAVGSLARGAEGLTGTDGHYVLEGLTVGTYRLARSDPEGYRSTQGRDEQEISIAPGDTKEGIDFALSRGYSVSGTVVDRQGSPVPKAKLYVQADDLAISEGAESDEDGRFVVKNLPPTHTLRLQAHTPDNVLDVPFQSEVMGPLEILDTDLKGLMLALKQPCDRRISGVVVRHDGTPLANIRVHAMPQDYRRFPASSESDQNGRFEVEGLAAGQYRLALQTPGTSGWSISQDTPTYEVSPDADLEHVRLVLNTEDTLSISGRVVDASGNSAAGATVVVRANRVTKNQTIGSESDGRYSIEGLPAGDYEVRVTHGNLTGQERQAVPAGSTGVDFILQERGMLAGHVVDGTTRRPIEAFSIEPTTVLEATYPDGRVSSHYSTPGFLEIRNKDGEFLLSGLEARKTIVTAQAPGYAPAKTEVVIVPGRTTSGITVALLRGGTLSGRVVDEAGKPVAGALLLLNSVPDNPERNAAARTDRDGRFTVDVLPPDAKRLLAYHPDFAMAIEDLPVAEGQPLEIVLRSGATVQGFVRLDGEGIANARLSLTYWRIGGFLSDLSTQSGPDGSYAFAHVNEADVRVTASIPVTGGQGTERSFFRETFANPETPVTLDFDFGALTASLEGTVTLHGEVPVKTWISLAMGEEMAREYFRSKADAAGNYVLENIPAGWGELEVWAENGELRSRKVLQITIPPNQTTRMDVDLAGSASLLINIENRPSPSPVIYLLPYELTLPTDPISPDIMQNWDAVATRVWSAGASRSIRFGGLESGTYTAVAVWDVSKTAVRARAITVTLEEGESWEADL